MATELSISHLVNGMKFNPMMEIVACWWLTVPGLQT